MKRKKDDPDDLRKKTILIVNTGSIKKRFIIQKIKKLGLTIIALNKEKNWAQPYIDHWILSDTTNHTESILHVGRFIKEHPNITIDGIITFWEDDVLLTSKLTDRYNFVGIPYTIAKKARNKHHFRAFCKANNLPVPKYSLIQSEKDIEDIHKHFSFPLVIKPSYGSSSAFVIKIENKEELRETYHYVKRALSLSVESALSDGLEILAEEYIDGDEVDIDILIQNGRIKFYAISDNSKTKEPFFIETERFTPSHLPVKDQEKLILMADETLEKLGVQNGCIHFEAKLTSHGPVPIEVNLRMGGDEIYSSIKSAWKVDLIEYALKIAFGMHIPKIQIPEEPYKYLVAKTLLVEESGIIAQIGIDPNVKKKSYLEEYDFFKKVGDAIMVPPEGYEYFGWLMVSGDNLLDAQDNLEEAEKDITYEVVPFRPTSSIGKTSRKNHLSFSVLKKGLLLQSGKIEKIRRMSIENQRHLHIGICYNTNDEGANGRSHKHKKETLGKTIERTLKERGYQTTFFDFNNLPQAFNDLKKSDVDLVFNVCDSINGSSLLEPHAAAILDTLQIPYTGSSVFTLSLCMDKIRVKKLLAYHKIPTPKWDYAYSMKDEIELSLKYPLIVKPAKTDNIVGITNDSVVTDRKSLYEEMEKVIVQMRRPVLVEEYIEGDEVDVSILGSEEDDLRVLPLVCSVFDKLPKGYWHIYPYASELYQNPVYHKKIILQKPAKINNKLSSLISEIALDTYNILDCHDYGRVEMRVDKNSNLYVLELNPNPRININDMLPTSAKLVGLDYGDFLEEIIGMAINRYKKNPPYYHLQPSSL